MEAYLLYLTLILGLMSLCKGIDYYNTFTEALSGRIFITIVPYPNERFLFLKDSAILLLKYTPVGLQVTEETNQHGLITDSLTTNWIEISKYHYLSACYLVDETPAWNGYLFVEFLPDRTIKPFPKTTNWDQTQLKCSWFEVNNQYALSYISKDLYANLWIYDYQSGTPTSTHTFNSNADGNIILKTEGQGFFVCNYLSLINNYICVFSVKPGLKYVTVYLFDSNFKSISGADTNYQFPKQYPGVYTYHKCLSIHLSWDTIVHYCSWNNIDIGVFYVLRFVLIEDTEDYFIKKEDVFTISTTRDAIAATKINSNYFIVSGQLNGSSRYNFLVYYVHPWTMILQSHNLETTKYFSINMINQARYMFVNFSGTYTKTIITEFLVCNNHTLSYPWSKNNENNEKYLDLRDLIENIDTYTLTVEASNYYIIFHNSFPSNGFSITGVQLGWDISSNIGSNSFYKLVLISFTEKHNITLEYAMIKQIKDAYIPSFKCESLFIVTCYESCSYCNEIGDENDNKCSDCVIDFYKTEDQGDNCVKDPLNYYFDQTSMIYRKCYETCDSCSGPGWDNSHNCDTCVDGYVSLSTYTNKPLDASYCVVDCDWDNSVWYVRNNYEFICQHNNIVCPAEFPLINKRTKQCVELSESYLISGDFVFEGSDDRFFTEYVIKYNIVGFAEINISIVKYYFSITILSTDTNTNLDTFDYGNFNYIDLGECKTVLEAIHGSPLHIWTTKINRKDSITGKTEFSVFNKSGEELSLQPCEKLTVNTISGINTDRMGMNVETVESWFDSGINVFDATDEFFNDLCFPFSSEKNTDIIIKDRRERYFVNKSLCEPGCEFVEMNFTLMTVECDCILSDSISEEDDSIKTLFISTWSSSNFWVFLCYKAVFNTGLFTRYEFYLLFFFTSIQLILIVIFIAKRKLIGAWYLNLNPPRNIDKKNTNMGDMKNISDEPDKKNNDEDDKDNDDEKEVITKNKSISVINYQQQTNIQNNNYYCTVQEVESVSKAKQNDNITERKISKISGHLKLNSENTFGKKTSINNTIISSEPNVMTSQTIMKTNTNPKLSSKKLLKDIKSKGVEIKNFGELGWRNIKSHDKIMVDFMMICKNKFEIYNIFLGKAIILQKILDLSSIIFGLKIEFALNALFYTDSHIKEASDRGGIFNFINEIPKVIYSFFLGVVFNLSITWLKKINRINKSDRKLEKRIIVRIAVFFGLIVLFELVFNYYILAFCGIYQNSKKNYFLSCLLGVVLGVSITFMLSLSLYIVNKAWVSTKWVFLYYVSGIWNYL